MDVTDDRNTSIFLPSELIEMKGRGIFDLLDEESKLPTPKPDHFTMEVHNRNKDHFRLSVSDYCRDNDPHDLCYSIVLAL